MSQFDEDQHIIAVLDEIGDGSKILADIGARLDGSNSALLIRKRGWTGVLVERNQGSAEQLMREFPHCVVKNVTATVDNVNDLVPRNAHFLSIDVDSCDWWLWANLVARPALVVIETTPAPGLQVAAMGVDGGYGCSVEAAKLLGAAKGYDYLGRTVVNAFFCRSDLKCRYRLPEQKSHRGSGTAMRNNVFA